MAHRSFLLFGVRSSASFFGRVVKVGEFFSLISKKCSTKRNLAEDTSLSRKRLAHLLVVVELYLIRSLFAFTSS